jgi:NAD(P)-dependent dehydrogenase (short-subunit alcohol dehydrogenase family)
MVEAGAMPVDPASWFRLDGEVAVVTGAGSGIGRAIAQTLAAAGMAVAAVDVSREAADATVGAVAESRGKAIPVIVDLGQPAGAETAIASAVAAFGRIDVLVNNAGIYRPAGTLPDIDWDLFERTQAINFFAPLRAMSAAARHMSAGRRIINISSMESLRPSGPGIANYAASKAALNAVARQGAVDFAERGIRVNAILPGLIRTEGTAAASGLFGQIAARAPRRRVGDAVDIAGAALFLASRASAYVNGHCLVVDGGMTVAG